MQKRKFKSEDSNLLTYEQVSIKSNLGIMTVMKLAKESGALIKIGRTARVEWDVFYNYITTKYRASKSE